jgi:hypothetical protein
MAGKRSSSSSFMATITLNTNPLTGFYSPMAATVPGVDTQDIGQAATEVGIFQISTTPKNN